MIRTCVLVVVRMSSRSSTCSKPATNAPWICPLVTDVNDLTLTCHPNPALADHGWTSRRNARGDTEWIPPPHLDRGQPRVNTYHHPEKLLRAEEDDEEP